MKPLSARLPPKIDSAESVGARARPHRPRVYAVDEWRGTGVTLVIALLLSFGSLAASCGAAKDTTVEVLGTGSDIEGSIADMETSNDEDRLHDDGQDHADESSPRPTGETIEDLGSPNLVRVPDVMGLSAGEAFARLRAAGFAVGAGLHDMPEPGVEDETVTRSDPAPGTVVPFGSQVTLDIYIDNQPDTSPVTPEELEGRRIHRETDAEFGDRLLWSYWDEIFSTFTLRILDLTTDEADRLRDRYGNESFEVNVSSAVVNHEELRDLNDSVSGRILASDECVRHHSAVGIDNVAWLVFVDFFSDDDEDAIECISDMKQAALSEATDFVEEHSLQADPADLVRFDTDSIRGSKRTDELVGG